jgi:hypothetical protein
MNFVVWGLGESLKIRRRREQKDGMYYINSSFMNCIACRIVLVDEMELNKMGGPCGTYGRR